MKNFKLFLIAALFVCLASSQFAQALTYQQLINSQGRVLGASTNGLIGYWKFDDGSGTSAVDFSGNNYTATISNSTWATGKINGGLSFNGTNSVVNLPANLPTLNDFTVSAWINSQSVAGNHVVWQTGDGGTYVELVPQYSYTQMAADNIGGTADNISASQWEHISLVRSGSTMAAYLNGQPFGSPWTADANPVNFASAAVGAQPHNWGYWFSGMIDEFRLYSRALSTQEISDVYNDNGGSSSPPPSDTTAPSVPTNLSAAAVSSSAINLSWTASTDNTAVTGYKIYRGGSQIGTSASNSYSDTGLTASTQYTYTVSAYDAAGNNSSQSTSANTTSQTQAPADTTAPSVPINLSATAVSSSAVNLSWTASSDNVGVTGYKIYRGGAQIGTSVSNSYSDNGLAASTQYTYTVSAYDAANNNSAQSTSASATTQAASAPGALIGGILDPSRAIDWTQAGVIGGIPSTNWTQCGSTIAAGTSLATINAAIQSCTANHFVKLGAGTFNLTGPTAQAGVVMKTGVVLRGSGANQTFLMFNGSDSCRGEGADICLGDHNDPNYSGGPDDVANWTGGYAKGTTQITLSSVKNLAVGSLITLDQLNDSNTDTGNVWVCETQGACSGEGPSGTGRVGRQQAQMSIVTNISGNTVTISPGLYMSNWSASKNPGAYWGESFLTNSGVEDLSIDNTHTDGTASILVINAYNVWVKGVRSINGNRSHVWVYSGAHVTVRDSYFYGTNNAATTSYGVEVFNGGDSLVENNIFQHVAAPMIYGGANSGTVYAYNYAFDDYYSPSLTWMSAGNFLHAAGIDNILMEGNISAGLNPDGVHGTTNFVTAFRNYFIGSDGARNQQTMPILLQGANRYYNIVGNVLGKPGYHTGYECAPAGATDTCAANANKTIYTIGFSGNQGQYGGVFNNDVLTKTTLMRWGNYDTVTGATRWNTSEVPSGLSQYANAVPPSQTLPASLYLSAKPAWWPSTTPWPPIGPDVSGGNIAGLGGHAYIIPAEACYNSTSADGNYPVDVSGLHVLAFNASNCYGSGGTIPPPSDTTPPAPPTGVSVQ